MNIDKQNTKIDGRKKVAKIDKAKAMELLAKGMSKSDVAIYFNVDKSAINNVVDPFIKKLKILPDIDNLRKRQLDIVDSAAMAFIASSTQPAKLKKASAMQCAASFGIMFDKSRVLQDKSTQIIEYSGLDRDEKAVEDAINKLRLSSLPAQIIDSDAVDADISFDATVDNQITPD